MPPNFIFQISYDNSTAPEDDDDDDGDNSHKNNKCNILFVCMYVLSVYFLCCFMCVFVLL